MTVAVQLVVSPAMTLAGLQTTVVMAAAFVIVTVVVPEAGLSLASPG